MRSPRKFVLWRSLVSLLLLGVTATIYAQNSVTFKYYYDDDGRLIKVIDSNGVEVDYTYDAVDNIVKIARGQAPASGNLAVLSFTPQSGPIGTNVTIQGQNFGSTPATNSVSFNGAAATIVSANATTIVATVPTAATTGPLSVTVNGNTAKSGNNFTVVSTPAILSINPKFLVSSSSPITIPNFTVTGANLANATFSFAPAFTPPPVVVNSAQINAGGTSATLNITVAAGTLGSFTLIATNAAGGSNPIAAAGNTLQIIDPNGDADGDGLTNAVEIAIGTDPLNPTTSGDGLPDGWQVFYGINPLDASVASKDLDNSGLTVLQDFQMGLSPRNPNRVPPSVSQISPKNAATGVFVNSVVVVRFAEPLLTGTTLFSAQAAIAAALGGNSTVPTAGQQIAAQTLQSYMNRTCCGSSVIPGTVSLFGPAGGIAGGVTASNDGLSVTFAPAQPLPANTTYTVQAVGVRDSAGNLMTKAFGSTFTTGSSVDNTLPQIKLVDPENNSSNVPTNVHYTVQFSKPMDPATLTPANFTIFDSTANAVVPGMVQVDADGMTVAFVPNPVLPIGRSFSVSLSTAVKDTTGNSLVAAGPFYFSTGYSAETAPPHWVTNSPGNNATGIPVNAIIDLQFSQPLDITTIVPNIVVSTGGQPIPIQVALSSGDQRVTITPVQGLQANSQYTVTIGAGVSDLAGLAIDNPGSFTFQTNQQVDKATLKVVSVDPGNQTAGVPVNALVRVGFSKQVNAVSLGGGNLEVYPYSVGGAVLIPGAVSISADGLSATFTPVSALQAGTVYCVYVNGVEDLEGQALQQNGQTLSCFTTGAAGQTGALTVVSVSPQKAATGVPVNAVVELGLSAPVSTVSVGAGDITLKAGSTAVAGTVSVVNATTLAFTPLNSLAVSTGYTVAAGGFTDLAGNAVTGFTSTFTTGSSPTADKGPLQVGGISPANGTTGVSVTSPVTVTFNEAVNPVTVNASSVNVQANGVTVAGSYAVSGAVVTFTPLTPLPGSATVHVYVDYYAAVEDLAGNNGQYATASFTTAATQDTKAPTVVSVAPLNGATGIGLNGQVVVTFSESMDPTTLGSNWQNSNMALLAEGQRLPFNLSVSADNRTAVLYSLNLPASTVITLSIPSAVTDLSGNALANFTSTFTTGPAFDTTHAVVVNQRPGNGAAGVGLNASPVVLFLSKALNAATVQSAMHVSENGQLVPGTVSVVGNGQTVEFTPSSAWQYGALVQVFLDATALDVEGNAVTAYQGSFTTAGDPAVTAPSVVNYSPLNGAQGVPLNVVMDIGYSQPLQASTVNTTNVTLNGPGGAVTTTVTLDASKTVIHLKPSVALASNAQYCFYAYNLVGTSGKAAQNLGTCFKTGTASVTTGPAVLSVSPANKLTGVPVNANIEVVFSSPVDPLTVSGTTIQVTGGSQTVMPSSIAFGNNNQLVEITPQAPLPASTAMTLSISGVTDVAGNKVTAFSSTFTTGTSPATTSEGIVAENPPAGATGVPVNAAISLQAMAPLAGTTVNSSTFQVYDNTLNQYVAGSYSLSADSRTAYFVPAVQLATGRTYSVYFGNYGMTDLAGNAVTACCGYLNNFSFTTGFSTSTQGPSVLGVSPANGLKQVPINAQIAVQFSEPVNAQSLGAITLTAGANAIPVQATLSSGNQLLTLLPLPGLAASTAYTLTVTGVTDLSGNAMTSPATSTFTTGGAGDFSKPAIVTITPSNGASGVLTSSTIQVQFNKFMDPLSLSNADFTITTSGLAFVPGVITVNANGTVATFTPNSPLSPSTTYTVQLGTGILDLEGQALAAFQSSFTTGSQ